MTTYSSVFGGDNVPPSKYEFRAFSLTANTTLYWPDNTDGTDLVANLMNVTPAGGAWTLTLPPANQVSTGRDILIRNLGAISFDVADSAGGALATLAAGESRYFYITSNATAAGTWSVFTYGTGTSSADASALAGAGLTVVSGQLATNMASLPYGVGYTISESADRGAMLLYTSGSTTWYLPDPTTIDNGFFFAAKNDGTGTLTLDASSNGGLIDSSNTLSLQPNDSCLVVRGNSTDDWYSIGYGRSNEFEFTQLAVDVTGTGGITITSAQAANKLWYFYNTAGGDRTVTIPGVASVYFIRVGAIGAGNDLTFTTGSGSIVSLSANQSYTVYCDGTNVVSAQTVAVTSSVSLDDGSAASPSLAFSLDTDTGIYRSTTNTLGIAANGAMVATFGSTGLTLVTPLTVPNGGTGVATITGVVKGNGTSALSAATPGTDFVAPGGALGTPSSGTLTNCTGLPVSTGISGLGANVATALATPTKANFDAALSDDNFAYLGAVQTFTKAQLIQPDSDVAGLTVRGGAGGTANAFQVQNNGSNPLFTVTGAGHIVTEGVTATGATGVGKFVFDTGPTISSPLLTTPTLGTPNSGTLTNCTGLPLATGVTGTLAITNGGTGQTAKTAAFDALSPTTTKGDLIVYDGTDNIRVGVGTNDYALVGDTGSSSGVSWKQVTALGGLTLPVSVSNGGTGATSLTGVLVGNGTSAFSAAVSGTDLKTVNSTSILGSGNIETKISNITSATTATTLTTTPTLLQITPAGYGVAVTLPDATTCAEGGPLHIIDNKGAYPVKVLNSAGTLIGFIYGGVVSHVSLIDNSTAAGTWSLENSELVGASAQLLTTGLVYLTGATLPVALDGSREMLVGAAGTTGYVSAVVYDKSSNTFGTPVVVRSVDITGSGITCAAALVSTDKVLVVSCPYSGTNFEAVNLTVTGTSISVGTAATSTLAEALAAFGDGCGLVPVPSVSGSLVTLVNPAGSPKISAINASGATPTIGSFVALDGNESGIIVATGDKIIAASKATTHLYTKPYTVSGSTLTPGTGTDTNSGTMTLNKLFALGTRWCALYNNGGATPSGAIISLSGTTTSVSTATLFSTSTVQDAIVVSSSKVLVLNGATSDNANILTDTAGTASAGTAITLDGGTTRLCAYVSGNYAVVQSNSLMTVVDCSSSSPVKTYQGTGQSVVLGQSNAVLRRSPNALFGTAFASAYGAPSTFAPRASYRGVASFEQRFPANTGFGGTVYRGVVDSERWLSDVASKLTKIELATGALA